MNHENKPVKSEQPGVRLCVSRVSVCVCVTVCNSEFVSAGFTEEAEEAEADGTGVKTNKTELNCQRRLWLLYFYTMNSRLFRVRHPARPHVLTKIHSFIQTFILNLMQRNISDTLKTECCVKPV